MYNVLCLICLVKSYVNLLYLGMPFSVIPFNKHVENNFFYLVSNLHWSIQYHKVNFKIENPKVSNKKNHLTTMHKYLERYAGKRYFAVMYFTNAV